MPNKKEMQKAVHPLRSANITSSPMGYNVPTYTRFMSPGEAIFGDYVDNFRLDPFGYPIMDNVDAHSTWYFVPLEQLYAEFPDFLRQAIRTSPNGIQDRIRKNLMSTLPWIPYGWSMTDDIGTSGTFDYCTSSELDYIKQGYDAGIGIFDQLKLRIPSKIWKNSDGTLNIERPNGVEKLSTRLRVSALPFLAYHKIMDDHFVDPEMEHMSAEWPLSILRDTGKNAIINPGTGSSASGLHPLLSTGMINPVYWKMIRTGRLDVDDGSSSNPFVGASDKGFHCRRANWQSDLLNSRRPNPQVGEAESIPEGGTIDDLRESTALQNLSAAQQATGAFLSDFYERIYGVKGYEGYSNKSIYIDGSSMGLDISDVLQTSETTAESPQANPVGYSRTVGENKFRFEAKGFGILMRITRVLPRPTYHYGIDPIWLMTSPYDLFSPKLRGIGWQPIPRAVVLPHYVGSGPDRETPSVTDQGYVTGWQPPFEYYRRQLSYTAGAFNILNGRADISAFTFARDYTGVDTESGNWSQWKGEINSSFRKADPTNRPFSVITDEITQVQHYASYDFKSESLVPNAVNHRDTLH